MKSETKIEDREILLYFLKSGLSTRRLDKKLGHDPVKSKGWKSWAILKKYQLETEDRNKLFCFRKQESLGIIKKIMISSNRKSVKNTLSSIHPNFFEKYKDIYIVSASADKVAIVLSGEVRNITQSFFSPLKKVVGICQFPGCNRHDLDTVHLQKSRPEHLKSAIKHGHILNTEKYDVYKILLKYIHLHSKKRSLCFLCKKHHQELSLLEVSKNKNLINFRNQIDSDL